METKVCWGCIEEKSLSEFHRQSNATDGLQARCKKCQVKYNRKYSRRRNTDPVQMEKRRIAANVRYHTHPNGNASHLKKYGITPDEYNTKLQEQGFACAICKTPQARLKRRLAVDHDHATGHIRGLLCVRCNIAIGQFRESHERMLAAIAYLQSPS